MGENTGDNDVVPVYVIAKENYGLYVVCEKWTASAVAGFNREAVTAVVNIQEQPNKLTGGYGTNPP